MEECGLAVEGGENEVGGVGHVAGDEDDALEACDGDGAFGDPVAAEDDGADADDNEK